MPACRGNFECAFDVFLSFYFRKIGWGEERFERVVVVAASGYNASSVTENVYGSYSPCIMRFMQPDTIIPDLASPQSLNRYSYVTNRPVNFNDPTGHKEDDCSGVEDCKVQGTKDSIEKRFKVKIAGRWKEKEIRNLQSSLYKMAGFVGGISNLNAAFTDGAQSHDPNATNITFQRVSGPRINPTAGNPAVAGWSNGHDEGKYDRTNILIADDTFSEDYQDGIWLGPGRAGPDYKRPKSFNTDQRIQFTLAHEMSHVLADANPAAVAAYPNGGEESMANDIAAHAISQGAVHTGFTNWTVSNSLWWNYP